MQFGPKKDGQTGGGSMDQHQQQSPIKRHALKLVLLLCFR